MGEVMLTVIEVAELIGCTRQHIWSKVKNKEIHAVEILGQASGKGGLNYHIPLSKLDPPLQRKYKSKQLKAQREAMTAPVLEDKSQAQPINHELITATEREQITFWKVILEEWSTFRLMSPLPKAEADEQYVASKNAAFAVTHPNRTLALKTLYKKQRALRIEGEAALIDSRGKHGNHAKKLTDEMFDIFEFYYLHQSKKAAKLCRWLTGMELKNRYGEAPELPSVRVFERAVQKIPVPCVLYYREGKKTYISKCAPYIERMYEDLDPNDIWVADGHTFDIMVRGRDGKAFRPYLSAFMDVRTRKFMGWVVSDKLCGDVTIYAMKRGVEKYGAPGAIQVDNGREYLFHDFSGDAGFRKKAPPKEGEFVPPTILASLGVEIKTTLPTNARGKAIERAFETVKETFSKLFDGYTGGNVLEKPDDLEKILKTPEKLIHIDEFMTIVDTYVTGYYNKQPHSGEGMWGRSPDEAYAELLVEKRIVPMDKLHLMFMRYSKGTVKVGKNGVTVNIYGEKLTFSDPGLWKDHFNEDVYVRYDPYDLNCVRVYNTDNQFICEAMLREKLSYNATKDEVQAAQRERKAQEKVIREHKKIKDVQAQHAFDAMINEAAAKLVELPENFQAKITRLIQPNETPAEPLKKAAGAEEIQLLDFDFAAAAKRSRENR